MSTAPQFGELGTGPLTVLDRRVLAVLRTDRAQRTAAVAMLVHRGLRSRLTSPWAAVRAHAQSEVEGVRAVLRGLEHLGVVSGRGGWWRKL